MKKGGFNIFYLLKRFLFSLLFTLILGFIAFYFFYPFYLAKEVIIPYGIHPFDICTSSPELWYYIKLLYPIVFFISHFVFSNLIYIHFLSRFSFFRKNKSCTVQKFSAFSDDLHLDIGLDLQTNEKISLPESGLYQNLLITGTIGTGKTSSALYPYTKQLLSYNQTHLDQKIGMLILDVKGNYYQQVKRYMKEFNLEKDLIVISLDSNIYYNPLHKPNLKPQVLANRLKTILLLFSENNSESYWLDKAEEVLAEAIKLCRLYNKGYVTFLELHKLITDSTYFKEKLQIVKKAFLSSQLNRQELYDFNTSLDFFQKEFLSLDERTRGILVSEITRITNLFISDYFVMSTFNAEKEKLTFTGFSEMIQKGKIVVLSMNIGEYRILSNVIAAYLKLDFQTEVLSCLSHNEVKTTAFICDEYDKYATKTDAEFFSISREAKCINIVSTQSYSSLKNTLKEDAQVKVIVQNLINKIWYRTDDLFTIEEAQKQLGREEKEIISKSISENAKETNFNYLTNTMNSLNSNLSETFSTYQQKDFKFETNFFTQELETFTALTFLSDGFKIYPPKKLKMIPYFKDFN